MSASIVTPSFPVQLFVPVAYPGTLNAVPASILSSPATTVQAANGGVQIVKPPTNSLVVNTVFDWFNAPLGNVSQYINACSLNFALNNSGASALLDSIKMVYINNTENKSDVTVYFPDTGMFVTGEAGSAGYYPVMTNTLQCYVFNGYEGTTNGWIISPPPSKTQILFCNFGIPGFSTYPETTIGGTGSFFLNFTSVSQQLVIPMGLPANPNEVEIAYMSIQHVLAHASASGAVEVRIAIGSTTPATNILFASTAGAVVTAAGTIALNVQKSISLIGAPLQWAYPTYLSGIYAIATLMSNCSSVDVEIGLGYSII